MNKSVVSSDAVYPLFRVNSRSKILLLCAIAFSTCAPVCAANSDAATLATALKTEEELVKVIARTNAAFVFVGGGSGVVVSPDGYILTNHHVAGDRKQVTVRIEGAGRMYVCDLIGTDPVGDLTLLKARDAENLAFCEFGDMSKLRVGQQVLAVGDPFKLAEEDGPPSVSLGTVSALHRFQGNYSDAIQTDSAVNPGNSGGPLLSLDGKLIGITGQIMSRFGAKANTGIGYAIPIDQIQRFYSLLKEADGKFVYHGTLPEGLTFLGRAEDTQVACVESVSADSEAQKAGFLVGDRIASVNGNRVYNEARLTGIVRSFPEKEVLNFKLERGGKTVDLKVTLTRHELPNGSSFIAPVGIKLEQAKTGDGVKVLSIEKNSPAEKALLQVGDLIIAVEGRAPTLEWYDILAAKKPGESIEIRLRRNLASGGTTLKALTLTLPDSARK